MLQDYKPEFITPYEAQTQTRDRYTTWHEQRDTTNLKKVGNGDTMTFMHVFMYVIIYDAYQNS